VEELAHDSLALFLGRDLAVDDKGATTPRLLCMFSVGLGIGSSVYRNRASLLAVLLLLLLLLKVHFLEILLLLWCQVWGG